MTSEQTGHVLCLEFYENTKQDIKKMNVQHQTSNVQHRMKNEYPMPNIQRLFLFVFSGFDTRKFFCFL